jgi:hypothetical protein
VREFAVGTGPKTHIWGFVGVVLAALIAAAALIWVNRKPTPAPSGKKYVSGIVADFRTKAPLGGVVVRMESADSKLLNQDTTDNDGRFSLAIPEALSEFRLAATFDGYAPYDRKLPAESVKNDIYLERLSLRITIPPGTSLESGMQVLGAKLNATIVFSSSCAKRVRVAQLDGAEIEGDPNAPNVLISALLTHVKDTKTQYRVTTIEEGKRYEISCS